MTSRSEKPENVTPLNTPLTCYLHIYKVTPSKLMHGQRTQPHYVSVVSLGTTREMAEQVAINLVHQRGYHILATDTATAAPWLDQDEDLPYLKDLERYGAAFQELAA